MDTLTCQAKFEAMQPPFVLATRATIFDFLKYKPMKLTKNGALVAGTH